MLTTLLRIHYLQFSALLHRILEFGDVRLLSFFLNACCVAWISQLLMLLHKQHAQNRKCKNMKQQKQDAGLSWLTVQFSSKLRLFMFQLLSLRGGRESEISQLRDSNSFLQLELIFCNGKMMRTSLKGHFREEGWVLKSVRVLALAGQRDVNLSTHMHCFCSLSLICLFLFSVSHRLAQTTTFSKF